VKIYVAARFHEKERVKKLYTMLKECGHTITSDWTMCQLKQPFSEHSEGARECAMHAITGVRDCEAFIFLTNPQIGAGSSAELGAALLSHISTGLPRIYVVGEYRDNNICFYHPAVSFKDTVEDVAAELGQVDDLFCNHQDTSA
jgi:hypothetical protein